MRRQGLCTPRCGRGLQNREICGQEISLRANRVEKWGSGHHNQMTRDRIHRRVQRANADSEKHRERREESVDRFSSLAVVGAVTVERRRMWRRVGEVFARSEKHDRIRENELR